MTEEEKEKLLRSEIHVVRELVFKVMQWGITVLAGTFYFLRKDYIPKILSQTEIPSGISMPFRQYIIGTIFLCVIAAAFAYMTARIGDQYKDFVKQLNTMNCPSGIKERGLSKYSSTKIFIAFMIFPLMDISLWLYAQFLIYTK